MCLSGYPPIHHPFPVIDFVLHLLIFVSGVLTRDKITRYPI